MQGVFTQWIPHEGAAPLLEYFSSISHALRCMFERGNWPSRYHRVFPASETFSRVVQLGPVSEPRMIVYRDDPRVGGRVWEVWRLSPFEGECGRRVWRSGVDNSE